MKLLYLQQAAAHCLLTPQTFLCFCLMIFDGLLPLLLCIAFKFSNRSLTYMSHRRLHEKIDQTLDQPLPKLLSYNFSISVYVNHQLMSILPEAKEDHCSFKRYFFFVFFPFGMIQTDYQFILEL